MAILPKSDKDALTNLTGIGMAAGATPQNVDHTLDGVGNDDSIKTGIGASSTAQSVTGAGRLRDLHKIRE